MANASQKSIDRSNEIITKFSSLMATFVEQNRTIASTMNEIKKNTQYLNDIHTDTQIMSDKLIAIEKDTQTSLKINWGMLFIFIGIIITLIIGLTTLYLK